jgi:hypothetical protein
LPTPRLSDELAKEAADAFIALGEKQAAATLLGLPRNTFCSRLKIAAERGMLGTKPVLPGFRLSKTTTVLDGDGEVVREFVQQKAGEAEPYEMPEGFTLKRDSAYLDGEGRRIGGWKISEPTKERQLAAMRAAVQAFLEQIPDAEPVTPPAYTNAKLLNQYTVTDMHFGSLAWHEETGDADYDLAIAEKLWMDWFTAAIQLSPRAKRAVFAQIGDLLHHDSHESVTPTHRHIIDSDSRLQKVIRTVIRCLRKTIRMLLEKHEHVHIIMADANHDPASEAWLREMFAAFYEDEPRITVEQSADTYYAVEHGKVSLFYHHSHRRTGEKLAATLAGKFREIYGRTKVSYAHTGHRHSDALTPTDVMKVEQHETLAARSSYEAHGGWLSGRSAKVITYHEDYGEVFRSILTPEMVAGASLVQAANDNEPEAMRMAA